MSYKIPVQNLPFAASLNDSDVVPAAQPDVLNPATGLPGVTRKLSLLQVNDYITGGGKVADLIAAAVDAEQTRAEGAEATLIPLAEKGAVDGVAPLDGAGLVPAQHLPSFVDDVVEAATFSALPDPGEDSKIYVTLDDNKTYRWSGTVYVEISASVALGHTAMTAYPGNEGADTASNVSHALAEITALQAAAATAGADIAALQTNLAAEVARAEGAEAASELSANKGVSNGYAPLNVAGIVPDAHLPASAQGIGASNFATTPTGWEAKDLAGNQVYSYTEKAIGDVQVGIFSGSAPAPLTGCAALFVESDGTNAKLVLNYNGTKVELATFSA